MEYSTRPIGVFDSGLGGISVLGELWKMMPYENYLYFGDSKNAPYGTKSEELIKKYTYDSISGLIDRGVKAVVIACNTATSVAANFLRSHFDIPIIGIEPAVKPAALKHKGGKIIVMATPMTLKKEKFISLMESYNYVSDIIPLPCPRLVEIIEKGVICGPEIDSYLEALFTPFEGEKIDAVVLGCTHYPFIKESIKKYFGYHVDVIDGGYGTAKETKRRLSEKEILNKSDYTGSITYMNSKNDENEIQLMKKMFGYIEKALR